MRLDEYLVKHEYFQNIKEAGSHIIRGDVLLDDVPGTKCGFPIKEKKPPKIRLRNIKKYVSRSAYKLAGFFDEYPLELSNSVCFDLGSSTGGFSQVLLEQNIKQVFCIDVGKNLLHTKVKNNEKVFVIENTNVKAIHINQFSAGILYPDIFWKNRKETMFFGEIIKGNNAIFITGDISFISLMEILAPLFDFSLLAKNKELSLVLLIKPQFELLPDEKLNLKKGILINPVIQKKTILRFLNYLKNYNTFFQDKLNYYLKENRDLPFSKDILDDYSQAFAFKVLNLQKAKLKGRDGNQEYVIHFTLSRENDKYRQDESVNKFLDSL